MSFSTRFFKRKPTAPAFKDFDKSTVTTALPPAPVPQDSTRVTSDGTAPATNATTDDSINADSGKPSSDTRQAATLSSDKGKSRVVDNTVKTGTTTSSTFSQPSLFQTFWNEETSHVLDPDVLENTNEWTPNALAMFEILSQTRMLSADHRDIVKRFPQYLDYATMIYYCYLFYIQILRARRSANVLTGEESRVLRRFERDFKPESLPIAGPLVPFFTSLVSTQIDDEQFSWVAPRIVPGLHAAGTTLRAPDFTNGQLYLQPALPHLVSILAYATSRHMDQAEITRTHPAPNPDSVHWNDEDNFVPYNFTANHRAAALWGINFNNDPAVALAPHDRLFSASGMTYPFVTDEQSLLAARKSWMNSNFNQLKVIPCQYGAALNIAAPGYSHDGLTSLAGLDRFLLMQKDTSSTFFEKLIENAAIHARCFKGNQNLSQIPTVGGSETLVLCTYQLNAVPNVYANTDVDITVNNKVTWYRNPFTDLRATFNTMIANPPRAETLQALTFGINATLPVTGMFDARNAVTDYTPFTAPHLQRNGPIWTHSSRKMEYRDEANQKGKEMFKYFGRVIHANVWNERL